MTKAHSESNDNGGRCESCNDPKTVFMGQSTWRVLCAGLGWSTMWVCAECKARLEQRHANGVDGVDQDHQGGEP